jgi:hypothetical protein
MGVQNANMKFVVVVTNRIVVGMEAEAEAAMVAVLVVLAVLLVVVIIVVMIAMSSCAVVCIVPAKSNNKSFLII